MCGSSDVGVRAALVVALARWGILPGACSACPRFMLALVVLVLLLLVDLVDERLRDCVTRRWLGGCACHPHDRSSQAQCRPATRPVCVEEWRVLCAPSRSSRSVAAGRCRHPPRNRRRRVHSGELAARRRSAARLASPRAAPQSHPRGSPGSRRCMRATWGGLFFRSPSFSESSEREI